MAYDGGMEATNQPNTRPARWERDYDEDEMCGGPLPAYDPAGSPELAAWITDNTPRTRPAGWDWERGTASLEDLRDLVARTTAQRIEVAR